MGNPRIALFVTGSIAAWKSTELLRLFQKSGAIVKVGFSPSAGKFVTSMTFEAISGFPVATGVTDEDSERRMGHIALANWADVVVFAPASANSIARLAHGFADDVGSATALASRAPLIIAPAMNSAMWESPATQKNISILLRRGAIIVDPECGYLACGWEGKGRMAEPSKILGITKRFLNSGKEALDARAIVSIGPTREPLDPVRFIGNRSSGKLGFEVARACLEKGAEVELLCAEHLAENARRMGVNFKTFTNAASLEVLLGKILSTSTRRSRSILFMAAAVADYRPSLRSDVKLPSKKDLDSVLKLEPNPDIISGIANEKKKYEKNSGKPLTIVSFAAETLKGADLLSAARNKLSRKGADYIAAANVEQTMDEERGTLIFLSKSGKSIELTDMSKVDLARALLEEVSKNV